LANIRLGFEGSAGAVESWLIYKSRYKVIVNNKDTSLRRHGIDNSHKNR